MGDYIFAKAFRIMADAASMDLIRAISRATERVSVGELRQIEETENYSLSEVEYLDIIADKTASLFAVSCETGPILNRRSSEERRKFAEFGEKIGTAFQIADDLLDFVGDPEATGKEPGNDVLNGQVTLPLICALRNVSDASGREVVKYLKSTDAEDEAKFGRINAFVRDNGGLDYTYRRAQELGEQALDSISGVGQSIYYDSLMEMVRYAVARAS